MRTPQRGLLPRMVCSVFDHMEHSGEHMQFMIQVCLCCILLYMCSISFICSIVVCVRFPLYVVLFIYLCVQFPLYVVFTCSGGRMPLIMQVCLCCILLRMCSISFICSIELCVRFPLYVVFKCSGGHMQLMMQV